MNLEIGYPFNINLESSYLNCKILLETQSIERCIYDMNLEYSYIISLCLSVETCTLSYRKSIFFKQMILIFISSTDAAKKRP